MTTIPFDPSGFLIIVKAHVWGPLGDVDLKLVLDTGSTQTLIQPHIIDELGFNPRDALGLTGVHSATGKEQGYMIEAPRFSALGFTRTSFPIHVFDLAQHYDIDGLIGLNFLRHYDYTVRSTAGLILIEEAVPATM